MHVREGVLTWRVAGARGMSPNRRRGAHWSTLRSDRDAWRELLAISDGRHTARGWHALRAVLTFREWGRSRDWVNMAAAFKWPEDALVAAGYIADDSLRVVRSVKLEQPDERPAWLPRGPGFEIEVLRLA